MTENETSPENLRKFLESDDPALVMMGLSMAKGIDCPSEIKLDIMKILLRQSNNHTAQNDPTVRKHARELFTDQEYAMTLKNIIINDKIKVKLRSIAIPFLSRVEENNEKFFLEIFKTGKYYLRIAAVSAILKTDISDFEAAEDEYEEETVGPIVKETGYCCSHYAMNTLIEGLNEKSMIKTIITELGTNKDKRIVEPLIGLFKKGTSDSNKKLIIRALNNFTDEKITKLLVNALGEKGATLRTKVERALINIDQSQHLKRNVLLTKNLQNNNIFAREISAKIIAKGRYLMALKPLKEAYSKYYNKKAIEEHNDSKMKEYLEGKGLVQSVKKIEHLESRLAYTNQSLKDMNLARRKPSVHRALIPRAKDLKVQIVKEKKTQQIYLSKIQTGKYNIKEYEIFGNIKKAITALENLAAGWEFESSSQPGKFYVVTKKGDILVCNCKGFRYKKNCSHIRQVIEEDEDKLNVELVKKKKFNDVLDRIGIKVANHLIKELELKAEDKQVDFRSNEQLNIITEEYPDFEFPTNKKQAIDLLLDILQNEKLRGRVAYSLGKIGEKRAVEPLLTYIWKGDLDTVLEIIDALGAIGDSHTFEPLEKLLRTSHSYTDSSRRLNVRIRAAHALALFGSKGIFTLASELENEYHGEAIDEFIIALAKACESSTDEYEKKDAAEAILTVVRKTELNVRYHFDDRLRLAAQALGNIGHQVALKPLREKLKEAEAAGPNPGYRSVTIQARPTPSDGAPEWLVESIKEAIKTIGAAKKALDKPKVKKAAAEYNSMDEMLADNKLRMNPETGKLEVIQEDTNRLSILASKRKKAHK